ncbi:hypothetical protein BJX99DRAFT_266044 [Aspergillus californicus]
MKLLKVAILVASIRTEALARPRKTRAVDVEAALANLGVDVTKIPQMNDLKKNACQIACGALSEIFGTVKLLTENTPAYNDVTGSYWAAQQEGVKPSCIFVPSIDREVSALVLISEYIGCPFAAKSGGHAAFAGASSSQGGITILFRDLNGITLNKDKSIASIGPGNVWGDVYRALEPHGLAAVGGRMSTIGVGGLVTGGGISYYSNMYGWALDNVESFEVVSAATGNIITASAPKNPDLYWALRGGGNNVGLITKFNLYTIPSPKLRGTTRVFSAEQSSMVLDAFFHVAENAHVDGNAQQYAIFGRIGGANMISAELTYTKDVTDPAIFEKYRSIPAVSDTSSSKTLVEYCDDVSAGDQTGFRELFWNRSFKLNKGLANWAVEHFYSVAPKMDGVSGAVAGLVFQVITEPMLEKMSSAGGNALGLDASDGPIHLMHILSIWNSTSDDDTIYRFANDFFNTVAVEAKFRGLDNDFVYMNYASQFQDVISSYGASSKAKLQAVAAKYDPRGVYQKLQPGYFKLANAPVPNPY